MSIKPAIYKVDCMWKNEKDATIIVDYAEQTVVCANYTDDIVRRPFGVNEEPTIKDFEDFLEDRCFSRSRVDVKELLKILGVSQWGYEPMAIARVTHGRCWEDYIWLKFDDEVLDYEKDIKVRN